MKNFLLSTTQSTLMTVMFGCSMTAFVMAWLSVKDIFRVVSIKTVKHKGYGEQLNKTTKPTFLIEGGLFFL